MELPRCECGERLTMTMGTNHLVCESCGYVQLPAYGKEKVNVAPLVVEINKTLPQGGDHIRQKKIT